MAVSKSSSSRGILAVLALLCGASACSDGEAPAPVHLPPSPAAGSGKPPYRLVPPPEGPPKVTAQPMPRIPTEPPAAPHVASPGTYWPDRACVQFGTDNPFARWRWCVESVTLRADGEMAVRCVWELDPTFTHGGVKKESDEGNRNMYVVDGRGRRYDTVATTGFVKEGGELTKEAPTQRGDFVFRAGGPLYSPLTFHDDDQKTAIAAIALDPARMSGGARRAAPGREDVATHLGRMRSADEVEILVTWGGLGPSSASRAVLHREGGRSAAGVAVPSATLDRFLALLAEAPVVDGPYMPRIEHTDDYPRASITIGTGDPVVFFSESQGPDRVPWAVQIEGRRYVIPSNAPARALDLVRAYLPSPKTPVEPRGRRALGDERPKPAPEGEALGRAVDQGDVPAVRRLLAGGADVNVPLVVGTPLTEAARKRQVEMVRVLLAAGADPFAVTSHDVDALSAAVHAGADDILSLLVDAARRAHGDDARSGYRRAMVAAAASGRAKPLRFLLAAGADPERGDDKTGESPLHHAAAGGQIEIVTLLLQAGARPDTADHRGFPPLVEAARNGHAEVVRALLKHGARSGLQDALEAAAVAGTSPPRDPSAQTVAALKDVVRMLLAAGADPHAKGWNGRSVMDILASMPQARGSEMLAVLGEGIPPTR